MATETPNFAFNLPIVGGSFNTWGDELNENWTQLDNLLHNIADLVYPIGSVMIRADDIDPATIFPNTTWVKDAEDRAIVGAGSNRSLNDTFGSDNHTLSNSQLPSHSHSSGNLNTNNTGNHSHSVGGNTNTAGNHSHGRGNLSTNNTGSHSHGILGAITGRATGNADGLYSLSDRRNSNNNKNREQGTSGNSGSHSHNINGSTDNSGAHSHSISGNTNNTGAHSHSINGNTGSVGSGSSFSITQRSKVFNIWRRTA